MVDSSRFEEFEWDSGNARKNEKRGVSQQQAEQVFLHQPLLLLEDTRHSGTEPRFHALGRSSDGRLLHVSFTIRGAGTRIRVTSARPMHAKERAIYDNASEAGA